MKNLNIVKIAAVVVGLAATLVSNYSQQKEMSDIIKKEVDKALANK